MTPFRGLINQLAWVNWSYKITQPRTYHEAIIMLYTFQMHSMVNVLMLHSFGCSAYFGYIFLLVDAILLELINSDFLLGSNFLRSNWYVMMNPINKSTCPKPDMVSMIHCSRGQSVSKPSSGRPRGLMDDSFDSHLETPCFSTGYTPKN